MLDFVDDSGRAEVAQESPRVVLGSLTDIERVLADVLDTRGREDGFAQRGLARLPRPGHGNERILPEQAWQQRGYLTLDHYTILIPRIMQYATSSFVLRYFLAECTRWGRW